jgi:hypothetical protein
VQEAGSLSVRSMAKTWIFPLHPASHRQRLAKVRLHVSGVVPHRRKYLSVPARQREFLHDGQSTDVPVLVAQTLENPLGGAPLRRHLYVLIA